MRKLVFCGFFVAIFNMAVYAGGGQNSSPSVSLSSPNNNTVTISIDREKTLSEESQRDWTEVIADISTSGSFIVALFAAFYAYFQYANSKREGRRSQAYQNYSSFLQLAFNNPKFANPEESLMSYVLDKDEIDSSNAGESLSLRDENLRYKYFVANMLFAFEQIFLVVGNESDWKAVMRDHLRRHKTYLRKSKSVQSGHWNEDFRRFIQDSIL